MIKWLSTAITTPKADKEIIAQNPLKPVGYNSPTKRCRIMKFHAKFSEDLIKDLMLQDNLTLWAYTDGECNE